MRKYVVGFFAGLLVSSVFPAYGATTSLIGKKIQNEYTVFVDGNKLDVKAISVDGTSYTPNRVLAEAVGYNISFIDNSVIFIKKEGQADMEGQTMSLELIETKIADWELQKSLYLSNISKLQEKIDNGEDVEKNKAELEFSNQQLVFINEKIAELEKRKAELEAQLTTTP